MPHHPGMAKGGMALRIESEDEQRVLVVREKMTKDGIEPSKSDVLRMLVLRGLAVVEPEHGIKTRAGGGK
jgi:hypothetical protein